MMPDVCRNGGRMGFPFNDGGNVERGQCRRDSDEDHSPVDEDTWTDPVHSCIRHKIPKEIRMRLQTAHSSRKRSIITSLWNSGQESPGERVRTTNCIV